MFWILYLLWPSAAEAHVHWFVQTAEVNIAPYQWSEPVVWLSVLSSIALLVLFALLTKLDRALWQRIPIPARLAQQLSWIVLIVGILFCGLAFHIELLLVDLGLVLYALCVWKHPYIAIRLLMIGVGLSFTQAAFSEKLLHPELSATFLLEHHWNFLNNLGLSWYTDRIFILHAGLVEALLGIALALGLAPRLVIVLLSIVCVITAYILGLSEVAGHGAIVMAFIIMLLAPRNTQQSI